MYFDHNCTTCMLKVLYWQSSIKGGAGTLLDMSKQFILAHSYVDLA